MLACLTQNRRCHHAYTASRPERLSFTQPDKQGDLIFGWWEDYGASERNGEFRLYPAVEVNGLSRLRSRLRDGLWRFENWRLQGLRTRRRHTRTKHASCMIAPTMRRSDQMKRGTIRTQSSICLIFMMVVCQAFSCCSTRVPRCSAASAGTRFAFRN